MERGKPNNLEKVKGSVHQLFLSGERIKITEWKGIEFWSE